MASKKRKPLGPAHRTDKKLKGYSKKLAKIILQGLQERRMSVLEPVQSAKEQPSIGLACTCFGKMHPDSDCPLHCGDLIR